MSSASGLRSLLVPLTPLYRFGLAWRERRLSSGREPIRRLRYPVISIGNLSTGGTGKTPLTIALAQALNSRGFAVDVLSHGYKRQGALAARVDPEGTADEFGDEPLMIARQAGVPVYVAPQRYDAGIMAEAGPEPANPSAHILDDGFQHRQLHRDIYILLLNRADWRDRLLPAGNLREDRSAATRAAVIAIPTNEKELESELRAWGWSGPVWRLHRSMEVPVVESPVLAFCGIARPEQFFAGVAGAGVHLAGRRVFPDHHRYTERDLNRLAAQARTAGASMLLTTEKDEVRLASLPLSFPLATVHLRTQIENEPAALDWIADRLKTVNSAQ
jgi:tetraacyldisaccharide 4'-kinase